MTCRAQPYFLLLIAGVLYLGNSSNVLAQSQRIGPSFNCSQAHDALSSLICESDTLAWNDLRFVQAYQALRQQTGPGGQSGLRQEAIDFQTLVYSDCSLPRSKLVSSQMRGKAEACVLQNYQRQRDTWVSRLSPPLQEEANRPPQEHIKLQEALQRLGYIPPSMAIDGVYGPATRTAIAAWQLTNNLQPTGILSTYDARLLLQPAMNMESGVPSQPTSNYSPAALPEPDEKMTRAAEELRLQISKAEAEKAKAEAERAQADAERARAEAEVFAAKERAEVEVRKKLADQVKAEREAHGTQP